MLNPNLIMDVDRQNTDEYDVRKKCRITILLISIFVICKLNSQRYICFSIKKLLFDSKSYFYLVLILDNKALNRLIVLVTETFLNI